jgi:xanthine/CO dehydrogenase XdhC/CoxF family maturation factor
MTLLMPENGEPMRNISGGCLEGDVPDVARIAMGKDRPDHRLRPDG